MDSRGRFIVARTFNPGELAMYDRRGRLVRTFGRTGSGPGEFGDAVQIVEVGPGDTIHVFERNRHTVLSPGLRRLISLRQLPFPPRYVAIRSDGRLVAQHMTPGSGRAEQPLHLLSARGEIARSFGERVALRPDQMYEAVHVVAPGRGNRVWSAPVNEYRLDLWAPDGARLLNLIRDAAWFRPWSGYDSREWFEAKPKPRVAFLKEDRGGRLWVSLVVPDRNWRPQKRSGEVRVADVDTNKMLDSVLEVLDPQRGRVLARGRLDSVVAGFLGNDSLIYTRREDSAGNILVDIWRVRLSTPE